MSLRRVLGWIWAIVGRVLLYGTACLVIAFLFVRQEWEQRDRSWQGRGRGGGGWRGDREPAERVIPAVNHATMRPCVSKRAIPASDMPRGWQAPGCLWSTA